jgi:hypothetical protein
MYRFFPSTARLIVAEFVIPELASFDYGKWADLQMLIFFGGRERKETKIRNLLSATGFELQEVVATGLPLSLLAAKAHHQPRIRCDCYLAPGII